MTKGRVYTFYWPT